MTLLYSIGYGKFGDQLTWLSLKRNQYLTRLKHFYYEKKTD